MAHRALCGGCERQQPSRSDAAACGAQTQGNESVKRGSAFYMRQAAAFYTQAIEQRSDNAEQNSVYYSNRAHTQLQLRNWGKALSDAHAAVELNRANVKVRRLWHACCACGSSLTPNAAVQACFRGAKAAAELGKHAEVLELCDKGLKSESHRRVLPPYRSLLTRLAADPANAELKRMQTAALAAQAQAAGAERRVAAARDAAERVAVRQLLVRCTLAECSHQRRCAGGFGGARHPRGAAHFWRAVAQAIARCREAAVVAHGACVSRVRPDGLG